MVAPACLLGIDWGTSKRRAYVIDAAGHCLRKHEDAQGALAIAGRFAASLQHLRDELNLSQHVPVLMSGMVGSASGWQEVAYLDSSVPLERLAQTLVPVSGAPGCFIVPGYCHRDQGGVDVMRGEETQLLGAWLLGHGDGCYLLPGTHSKWVELSGGLIVRMTTFMTGELFATLQERGTLAALMGGGIDDTEALRSGAIRAQAGDTLSHTLFEARARVVAGDAPAGATRSYVSGLLIGSEFAAQHGRCMAHVPVRLLAAAGLSTPYRDVARLLGYAVQSIDPDQAYCTALLGLMEEL